jgi:hypothetical protein
VSQCYGVDSGRRRRLRHSVRVFYFHIVESRVRARNLPHDSARREDVPWVIKHCASKGLPGRRDRAREILALLTPLSIVKLDAADLHGSVCLESMESL